MQTLKSETYAAIRYLIFLSVLSIIVVPTFSFSDNILFSAEWLKELDFIILVGIASLILTICLLWNQLPLPIANHIDIAVTGYFIYSFINCLIKKPIGLTIPAHAITSLGVYITYCICRVVQTLRILPPLRWETLLYVIAISNVILVILQWRNLMPSGNLHFNVTGGFSNPGPLGIYLGSILIPLLWLANSVGTLSIKFLRRLLIFFLIVIIIYCYSRASWIGVLFGLGICIIMDPTWQWGKIRKIISSHWILVSIIFLCFAGTAFRLKVDSAIGRILIWTVSLNMFKEHPITGVGSNAFQSKYAAYQHAFFASAESPSIYRELAGDVRYAFNDFFQILCEEGILGFLLFISILLISAFYLRKRLKQVLGIGEKNFLIACLGSICCILTSALFAYPLSVLPIRLLFWISIALISGIATNYQQSLNFKGRVGLKPISVVIFVFFAFFFLYYGLIRKDAIIRLQKEQPLTSNLIKHFPIFGDEPAFLLTLARAYMKEGAPERAISFLTLANKFSPDKEIYYELGNLYMEQGNYRDAERCFRFIYISQPSLIAPKYFLARLYFKSNQKEKWQKFASEVLNAHPKIVSFTTIQMQHEIQRLMLESEYKFK